MDVMSKKPDVSAQNSAASRGPVGLTIQAHVIAVVYRLELRLERSRICLPITWDGAECGARLQRQFIPERP
jgi:hypothetical protein